MLHRAWRCNAALPGGFILPFVFIECAFFAANLLKVPDGGYVPLLLGAVLVVMMWTWSVGTKQIFDRSRTEAVSLEEFIPRIEKGSALCPPGVVVFLTSDATATPPALLHNLKHNGVLHEHIIVVAVETADAPRFPEAERAIIEQLSDRFERVRFGFMETPNVNRALGACRRQGLDFEGMKTSFFLGRRKLVSNPDVGMLGWQDWIYILMSLFAADPSDFYHFPRGRVVEMSSQDAV